MKLRAYAKINLTLDVTGLREDGYHLLDTVMQSVSLYDRVEVQRADTGVRITCDKGYIPTDERNSAFKAARAFFDHTGLAGGAFIRLHKRIPSRAGLGGGSADAAAVLYALNQLYDKPLDDQGLRLLGAKVGADVPFCLFGGTLRCTGVGEELSPAPPMPDCSIVICKPPVGISTPRAYAQLDHDSAPRSHSTPKMLEALAAGDLISVSKRLYNRFDLALRLMRVREIKTVMHSAGALGTLMTGSGSAVYGIFSSFDQARGCAQLLEGKGEVFVTRPVTSGLEEER